MLSIWTSLKNYRLVRVKTCCLEMQRQIRRSVNDFMGANVGSVQFLDALNKGRHHPNTDP